MYDLIIIGGGPAGVSAGVYAARKRLHTLFITADWGGQSIVSEDIQNWIGAPSIPGSKLASDLRGHLESYAGDILTVLSGKTATNLQKLADGTFEATTSDGATHTAKAILIASGSGRRKLTIPGAAEYEHKGLTYCASCDGPLFSGQDVVVIGGGNAGFESAAQLLAYCKSVTLIHHSDTFKADAITVEKVLAHPNMRVIKNAEPIRIEGEKFVNSITYRNTEGEEVTLPAAGIFVEIGMIPNTDYAKEAVTLDAYGRVEIDPWTQATTTPGIWAAGDCTNVKYHQNNIAAGDAVRALEDIYVHLKTRA
ncbi:FAD-dependent oxidoreductase [Patescibacteria group bacterium]|nr:FAD-dependent oxidoreductase [Patescibacteria group bacterium]